MSLPNYLMLKICWFIALIYSVAVVQSNYLNFYYRVYQARNQS